MIKDFLMKEPINNLRTQISLGVNSSVLLFLLVFTIFIVPVFPEDLHSFIYKLAYTFIFIISAILIRNYRRYYRGFVMFAIAFLWLVSFSPWQFFNLISFGINVIVFCITVINIIYIIAKTKDVTVSLIIEAILGYLLLGFMYAIVMTMYMQIVPEGINFVSAVDDVSFSEVLYFSFVSFSTLGFGEILPVTPMARSLVMLITISGQLYLAIIMGMIIGKYNT